MPGRKFFYFGILVDTGKVSQLDYVSETLLIIVKCRGIFGIMYFLYRFCNSCRISGNSIGKKLIRFLNKSKQSAMLCFTENLTELRADFFIRNAGKTGQFFVLFCAVGIRHLLVSEVTQMNEQRKDIVFIGKRLNIVLEEISVHSDALACNQTGNILLKTINVHIDIGHQCFCRGSLFPIRSVFPGVNSLHHRIGVIYRVL